MHLVPSALVALAALPMTAGGKVDRSALPEPPAATATARPVPAGDDTERRIAAVWQEVLDLDRVGVHDNFFDLGGNSFALAAAHARLTEAFEGPLPLVALYEHPTIAALARHLTRAPEPRRPDAPAPEAARLRAGRARLNRRRRAG
ncbi:phosphopantetheine-binding protein [Actinomadura namibiensis]|uniref:phosphopantetheine-binding protein n=1 Tax=Actinomadura kijaniata TaxID=46161 RepID=UPI0036133C38